MYNWNHKKKKQANKKCDPICGQNELFYSNVAKCPLKLACYIKDPFESKYQLLINGKKKVGIEKL